MNSFLETQSAMAYNLNGTSRSLEGITDNLGKALGGTGLVKQQEVYKNLQNLVNEGILYNVEQRAFLQTISDDLNMVFDASNGSLTRLINLQRVDLSSNRMAIEASLKEFLNQNFETSQYIKDGFANVSNALLEAQSIMNVQSGINLEAVVQQWMGSLSSVGMSQSTIDALATAIGQLGSGNISALSGSNMQNLLVMGAARSGQSYAQMLTEGLTGESVNELMRGIVGYIQEIGESTSNVVRSEYGRIFGLNVSDIVAASQVGNVTENGVITDDISRLLGRMNDYVYSTQQINNTIENFMYDWATGVVSDRDTYTMYRMTDMLGSVASQFVGGMSLGVNFLGNQITTELGPILSAAPLIATLSKLADSIGNMGTNIGDTLGNVFGDTFISKLVNENTQGIFSDGTNAVGARRVTGANRIFNLLGNGQDRSQYIRSTGLLGGFTRTSGIENSGAMIIGNTNVSDIARSAKTSATDFATENLIDQPEEYYDTTDLYKLLSSSPDGQEWLYASDTHKLLTNIYSSGESNLHGELTSINSTLNGSIHEILNTINDSILSLPQYEYSTYSKIVASANTVTIGNDLSYVSDVMTLSAMNIQNIYNLLFSTFIEGAGAYKELSTEGFGSNDTNRAALGWGFNPNTSEIGLVPSTQSQGL